MNDRAALWQGLKFIGVGVSAALVYFCLALLFDKVFGLPPIGASVSAYVLAAIFSYAGHKIYTFNATGKSRQEVMRFALSTLIGFSLATIIPYLLGSYPSIISYLTVLVIVPATSFLLLKFFVFSEG